jgi:lysozyme
MNQFKFVEKPSDVSGVPSKPVETPKPVNPAPPIGNTRIYGIDVSHYQSDIDWNLVAAMGKKFAFAKASDGLSANADSMYAKHRAGAKQAGLIFGSYHFFRFGTDAIQQAEIFLRITKGVLPGELPLSVDLEWDKHHPKYANGSMDESAALLALKCLEKLEAETGMAPIIYTSAPFFTGFSHPERFARFHPWLAAYSHEPKVPAPWKTWRFWQYSESEKIKGVDAIDGDQFAGTLEDLKGMVKK